jgi:hypothetical protein
MGKLEEALVNWDAEVVQALNLSILMFPPSW